MKLVYEVVGIKNIFLSPKEISIEFNKMNTDKILSFYIKNDTSTYRIHLEKICQEKFILMIDHSLHACSYYKEFNINTLEKCFSTINQYILFPEKYDFIVEQW